MLDARETLLHEIKDRLIIYAARVRVEHGKLSDGAEEFYRGLLNIVLGCSLKNMNHERDNFPAIDLGDDDKRICAQVSSTGTRTKVRHTLKEFFEKRLHERFDRLIVLVVGDAERFDTEPKNDVGFDFQTKRDIWDTKTLIREIGKLEDEVLEKIAAYLRKRVNLPDRKPLLELPMESAMDADYFVGREEKLEEIAKRFRSAHIVFLSGLGGMGKTELALRYGTDCQIPGWRFVYFVRFKKSFEQTLAENIAPFIPGFSREGLNEQQILEQTRQILHRADPNDLLILDNADDAKESIDELRRKLSSIPMRILVTTRAESSSAVSVDRMDNERLHDIFRNYGAGITESEMDELIAAVDGHTLTVDLMARLLHRKQQTNTYQALRDALRSRDLENADLRAVTSSYYGDEGQARINEHLKTVFQVAKLGAAEQTLLRFASLLPQCGLDAEIFAGAAVQNVSGFLGLFRRNRKEMKRLDTPPKVKDVLQTLTDGGWLEWEGDVLKIHPVICIVCLEVLEPTRKNCHAFVKGVWGWCDDKKYDYVRFRQMAELLVNASGILRELDGWYIHTAGHLWSELGEPQQALQCKLRAVELVEQSRPDSDELATAYNNVGVTYGALGNHAKALEYQQKALAIREKVLPPEHPSLATSYNNLGSTYSDLGDHAKALEYKQKALAIREKVLPPEHPDLAAAYNNVGVTYGAQDDHGKALEYEMKALAILEEVLPPEHPDLAASYNNVGGTYGALGDHAKALEYQQKALAIREKILPPAHPDLATSYNNVGSTYYAQEDYVKALEYQQKALAIQEETLPENHPYNVTCCNNIAWTYYEMGDYEAALKLMRRTADIAERSLPEGHPDCVNYRRWAEQMEREIADARSE